MMVEKYVKFLCGAKYSLPAIEMPSEFSTAQVVRSNSRPDNDCRADPFRPPEF